MSTTTTTSITGTLSGTETMGIVSATESVSGTHTWSTTESKAQTTAKSYTLSDDISAPLPPHTEFDIVVSVIREEVRVPITVDAVLDGDIDPCLDLPQRTASALLEESARTFTLKGDLIFSHADHGQITVTSERPAQCTGE